MFRLFSIIYDIFSTIGFILFYPFVAVARLHTGKDTNTRRIKLGLFEKPQLKDSVIMFHAVSVGEVLSLEKLLKQVKASFPDCSVVLTTGTKTGQELAKKKYSEILDFITYFPFDFPISVNNFLNRINPNIVLIAETELWPDFAIQCMKRNIPLVIINGRISDESYSSYKWLKPFFSLILNLYSKIYTQSELDNERFISLGVKPQNAEVMANLKFDIDKPVSDIDLEKNNNKVLIAGSTHSGENEIVIKTFVKLRTNHNNLKLIIAPRHLERISEIENLLKIYNFNVGYRSKNDTFIDNDIIILDTLGELKKAYAISDVAFIGGSFNKTGGHNPLEATIYNVPTVSGGNIKNFRDIYSILTRANASRIVKTEDEFFTVLEQLFSNKECYQQMVNSCKDIFKSQKGAIEFVINVIDKFISLK